MCDVATYVTPTMGSLMEGREPRMNGVASFINKVFLLQWHIRNINRFIWREKETARYIHSQDEPTRLLAGAALFTLSHTKQLWPHL